MLMPDQNSILIYIEERYALIRFEYDDPCGGINR